MLPASPKALSKPALTILKPNETDPDYLTDYSGHYRLAINHLGTPEQRWEMQLRPMWGYRPLPQARKFHRSQSHFRFCTGGNRSSKSRALAIETLWAAVGFHPFRNPPFKLKPTHGWYATTTFQKLGELWRDHFYPLLKNVQHRVIWHNRQFDIPGMLLIGNSRVTFKAYEQGRESFQAAAIDYAHFDEPFPHDIFLETITRIGADQEMRFATAMTPIEPMAWLEDRLVNAPKESDEIFEFPLDDNRASWGGFIPDERIDALIEQWPPEVRETRRRGKWGSFVGAIFQSFNRGTHVVDEAKERRLFFKGPGCDGSFVPAGCVSIGSIDWGGANPFVFLWATRIPWLDDEWYVFDEYYWNPKEQGMRRLQQHADEIKGRTSRWRTQLGRIWADHDPTDANEMREYGVPSNPASKGRDSTQIARAGIEDIWTLLAPRPAMSNADWPMGRPRVHFAERCKFLNREMALYRWTAPPKSDTAKDAKDVPLKKDDHAVDAFRYLIASEKPYWANGACPEPLDMGGRYKTAF